MSYFPRAGGLGLVAALLCSAVGWTGSAQAADVAAAQFRPTGGMHRHAHAHHSHRRVPVARASLPRWRSASWHCNPWYGPSTLQGPLLELRKGYRHGVCHQHRTGVDHGWRRWHHRELGTRVSYDVRRKRTIHWRYRSMIHHNYWHQRQHTPGRLHD